MGTPANIIIKYVHESFLLPKGPDEILLFCHQDGYPFELQGVMYLIIKAYKNLQNIANSNNLPILTPEQFAAELTKLSQSERFGSYRITPATSLMYQQYKREGYFVDSGYEYICNFQYIDSNSPLVSVKIKSAVHESTRIIDEWKESCDIAYRLARVEHRNIVLMDDDLPCLECIVRSTCLTDYSLYGNEAVASKVCDRLSEYKEYKSAELRKKLPDWAKDFVTR